MDKVIEAFKAAWPYLGPVLGFFGSVGWIGFARKKERRLFRNIRRPIAIIGTDDKPMTHEAELLERVGFFNVGRPTSDARAVDLYAGKRLVIIGYTPNDDFRTKFNAARARELPIIVYSGPARVESADMTLLQGYSHHSLCNTPLRLISDVFAILSTYPEDK